MQRIIIVRPGALGDTILTIPALAALRSAQPSAELVVVGNASALRLAGSLVDHIHSVDSSDLSWLFFPSGRPPDFVTGAFADADLVVLWLRASAEPTTAFRALGARQVVSCAPLEGNGHVADRLARSIAHLAPVTLPAIPSLIPDPLAVTEVRDLLGQTGLVGDAFAVIHPGSGGRRKCWPAERFGALADLIARDLGLALVFVVGPADEEALTRASAASRAARRLDQLSLPQLAALCSLAAVYVGNDSGPSHLAAAVGAPTLTLYGPTNPAEWGTRGRRVAHLYSHAACPDTCDTTTCLASLEPATVFAELRSLL
ncbi:MAG: glycosyltransferase family 9 protein [Chloroflexi bacterium]|nr:glycosyltransferase family 9 protein [Chloroflexota bacterium]